MAIGAVISLPALASEWSTNPFQAMSARGWLSLVFLSVVVSGLATLGMIAAIKRLGPTRTSIFLNLIPFWTIVSASLLLGEQLLPSHVIGGLLLLVGVSLASVRGRNGAAADESAAELQTT
jgi:drug/metabolite transporter (DMT)-like permease